MSNPYEAPQERDIQKAAKPEYDRVSRKLLWYVVMFAAVVSLIVLTRTGSLIWLPAWFLVIVLVILLLG